MEIAGIQQDNNPNDYTVGGWVIIQENKTTLKIEYNQSQQSRTYYACGIYASIGCISDFTGYKFSTNEILEIVQLAEDKYGFIDGFGMSMSRAVDCVRDWWNMKHPTMELITYNLYIGTEDFYEALKKWNSLAVWGNIIGSWYIQDAEDNGIIEKTEYLKGKWHLVRCYGDIKIIDNYFSKKKFNIYKNDYIVALKDKWIFFPSAYLFQYKNDGQEEEARARIKAEIVAIIKRNKEQWIKRIRTYDELKAYGYTKTNIEASMREVYGLPAIQ